MPSKPPINFVLLCQDDDQEFLAKILELVKPELKWYGGTPPSKFRYIDPKAIQAYYCTNGALTYATGNQKQHQKQHPRFTGPEFLKTFVFGEGPKQSYLDAYKITYLGPNSENWDKATMQDLSTQPYWTHRKNSTIAKWLPCFSGDGSPTLDYALPYKHPLLLKHIARVLGIPIKTEHIKKEPRINDIFQI